MKKLEDRASSPHKSLMNITDLWAKLNQTVSFKFCSVHRLACESLITRHQTVCFSTRIIDCLTRNHKTFFFCFYIHILGFWGTLSCWRSWHADICSFHMIVLCKPLKVWVKSTLTVKYLNPCVKMPLVVYYFHSIQLVSLNHTRLCGLRLGKCTVVFFIKDHSTGPWCGLICYYSDINLHIIRCRLL